MARALIIARTDSDGVTTYNFDESEIELIVIRYDVCSQCREAEDHAFHEDADECDRKMRSEGMECYSRLEHHEFAI